MTRLLTPEGALSRIPGFERATGYSEIGGGLTNRSFVVRSGGARYVLRLDAEHTAAFGLDRSTELGIWRCAAAASLAPEIRFADPEAGILVYDHLPGPVWSRVSLDDHDNLARAAALLRAVHGLPRSGVSLDALAAALRYEAIASRHPERRGHAARCVDIIRTAPEAHGAGCCHNDVVASNIVGGIRPKLIDWEYACDNDPYFDLASLIAYHDLPRGTADRLLAAYAGGANREAQERLQLQLRRYDALQWLWFAARHALEPNGAHGARLDQLQRRTR